MKCSKLILQNRIFLGLLCQIGVTLKLQIVVNKFLFFLNIVHCKIIYRFITFEIIKSEFP